MVSRCLFAESAGQWTTRDSRRVLAVARRFQGRGRHEQIQSKRSEPQELKLLPPEEGSFEC